MEDKAQDVVMIELHDVAEINQIPEKNFYPDLAGYVDDCVENKAYLGFFPNSLVLSTRDNIIQLLDIDSKKKKLVGFFYVQKVTQHRNLVLPTHMLN
jgi:hypothetical protein